jgi:hypothetical protein
MKKKKKKKKAAITSGQWLGRVTWGVTSTLTNDLVDAVGIVLEAAPEVHDRSMQRSIIWESGK